MTEYEKKLLSMTPEQREKVKKEIGEMMGMPEKTAWIVSCDPNRYVLDAAFHDLGNIEWQIGKCGIKRGDIIYIYVGRKDKAIRYKCIAVSDKRNVTTIDDYWYGGNHAGVEPYPCIEIEPIGYYPGEGIKYESLLEHGLKGSVRSPIRAIGDLGRYIRHIKVRDYAQKDLDELKEETRKLSEDIKSLSGYDIETVVKSRRNQGIFRRLLMDKYEGKCCLCGLSNRYLLVASHIKPWHDSTNKEKVSVNNGLLLCPNHDRLFDAGFISFDATGKIMISKAELNDEDCKLMNINKNMRISISEEQQPFFKYHRENIFSADE